jgi:hypothetical protein
MIGHTLTNCGTGGSPMRMGEPPMPQDYQYESP